jgi:hypothetical protein
MSSIKALLKTEPSEYSFDDLGKDGTTLWSGIHNYAALRNLETLKVGDAVAIYHTGAERTAVGIAIVTRATNPPGQPEVPSASDPRQRASLAQSPGPEVERGCVEPARVDGAPSVVLLRSGGGRLCVRRDAPKPPSA